jgi:ABC-type sulfate transport system permease component
MTTKYVLRFTALGYLAALLIVPVGLVARRAFGDGLDDFWAAITTPEALHALWLTVLIALIAVPVNTASARLRSATWLRFSSARSRSSSTARSSTARGPRGMQSRPTTACTRSS